MITRFRLEARADTKEQVQADLDDLATDVMNRLRNAYGQAPDAWNITDDVISREGNIYRGRVVYAFKY